MTESHEKTSIMEKTKHVAKSLNHHLGTPGWISVATLVIVLIALGVLGSDRHHGYRGERRRRESYQERMQNNDPFREVQNVQKELDQANEITDQIINQKDNENQNTNLSTIFSMNDSNQYNVNVKNGQVDGFFKSQVMPGFIRSNWSISTSNSTLERPNPDGNIEKVLSG